MKVRVMFDKEISGCWYCPYNNLPTDDVPSCSFHGEYGIEFEGLPDFSYVNSPQALSYLSEHFPSNCPLMALNKTKTNEV